MSRANQYGTALTQALPWLSAIDDLADAARALLDRQGSEAELALALEDYKATARQLMGQSAPPRTAYDGLSQLRYPG